MATQFGTSGDQVRFRRYRSYLKFYQGEHWDTEPRAGERRLSFNYARIFVNKLASYLMGHPPAIVVRPAGASPADVDRAARAETALREISEANQLDALDFDVAVDSGVLGDGAFKVIWDAASQRVLVSPADVSRLHVTTSPDDARRVTGVVQTYTLPRREAEARFGISLPTADPALVAEEWATRELSIYVGDRRISTRPNPYAPDIPFVIFPNVRVPQEFWGESDLVDVVGVNRELNKRFSVLSHILEVSGNPIAVLENVDSADNIKVGPGALWELPENARAYLLDLLAGGGVKLHVDYVSLLYRAMHDLSEMPRTAFGESGNIISGVALETELQPMLQKLSRKRAIWTRVIQERSRLALSLLERFSAGGSDGKTALLPAHIDVLWPPILPTDRQALIQGEVALVQEGIHSRRTAMERLGDPDPEHEMTRIQEESTVRLG